MSDPATRRFAVAALLRLHAVRVLGPRLDPDATGDELLDLADRLRVDSDRQRAWRVSFEPAYPGATAGVEALGGRARLVLACRARHEIDGLCGTPITTLIPGRAPTVSLAPDEVGVPARWRPLP